MLLVEMAKKTASEEKNPDGRALVKLSDLTENWRDVMHNIYREGGSDAEVKVALAIFPARALSNDLWDDLQKREPEFSESVKESRLLAPFVDRAPIAATTMVSLREVKR